MRGYACVVRWCGAGVRLRGAVVRCRVRLRGAVVRSAGAMRCACEVRWCGSGVRLRAAVVRCRVRLRGAVVRSGVRLRAWCGGALRGTPAVVRRAVRLRSVVVRCGSEYAQRRPADSLCGVHRNWRIQHIFCACFNCQFEGSVGPYPLSC